MQARKVFRNLGIAVLLGGMFAYPLDTRAFQQTTPASEKATQSAPAPLTLDEVIRLIKQNNKDARQVVSAIADRGVSFDLDEKTEKKLRKAGANNELLPEIWKITPKGKAHIQSLLTSPSGVQVQASPAEAFALRDIQNEPDPDQRVRMAHEFEEKFPGSALLSYVFTAAAKAHQDKGELDEAVATSRKSLRLDPDNTFSLIILALVLPTRKELQGSPNEVRQRLLETETDANRALALLEKLKPWPDEPDAQFQQRKGSLAADAHFALGMAASQENHYDDALTQYQLAISSSSKPTFQYYYRLAEAYASVGQVAQAIDAVQKASDLAHGTPMQKYADDFMAELRQRAH
jgi:tetratricopeptide (TPR) repeat protein